MAGPNLEIFKFGLYLFFPLAVMVHYGDPDWYRRHVLPIRDEFWPKESTLFKPPRNPNDLKSTLDEMKEQRLARREARLRAQEGDGTSNAKLPTSKHSQFGSPSQQAGILAQSARWESIDRQRLV
ncbi:unnamed protein product [Parajaminaea phylloscopi]